MTRPIGMHPCSGLFLLLVFGCASAPRPWHEVAPLGSWRLTANSARVGHHVTAALEVYESHIPPSCAGGWNLREARIAGTLPAGMRLATFPIRIEGTPRQPGTWRFRIVGEAVCWASDAARTQGAPPQEFGSRSIDWTFTVNP